MDVKIDCKYFVENQTANFDFSVYVPFKWIYPIPTIVERIDKNTFLTIVNVFKSKNSAILNFKNNSKVVKEVCKIQLKSKETTFKLNVTYFYKGDEYTIKEEEEDVFYVKKIDSYYKKGYQTYTIRKDPLRCNCMSYKIGNSKFGKKNCKHMEFIKHGPFEIE